jgi:hypothetical protein
MIRGDLAAARETWLQSCQDERQRDEMAQGDFLAYRDQEGRYIDFHALRHSFITMVGKMGVSPKEHQDLARHSSYALTSRYSHSRFYDLAAAVQSLPIPTAGPRQEATPLAATGTDGRPNTLAPNLAPRATISADLHGQTKTIDDRLSPAPKPGKHGETLHFPGSREERQETTSPDGQSVAHPSGSYRTWS